MILLWFVPLNRLGALRLAGLMVVATLGLTMYSYAIGLMSLFKGPMAVPVNSYLTQQVNPLRVALAFVPLVLYIFLTRPDCLEPEAYFYVNMGFINAAVMIAGANSAYLTRFAIYTGIFSILLIPRLLNMRDRRLAAISGGVLVSVFWVFWYVDTVKVGASLADFNWIFNHN